ncbi:MAG: NUDIX hydrolase [Thermoleophilia bacterium]
MDPSPALIRAAESTWGVPRVVRLEQELLPWELDLIERVCGNTRHHDVTVFLLRDTSLAVVRKSSDPHGVWWAPAGGVAAGEDLSRAGEREAYEETGLTSRVERYVARFEVVFTCGDRRRPWVSHVMQASWVAGEPAPMDTKEVESAAWMETAAFADEVAPLMVAAGWGRFQYRLRMAQVAFAELGLAGGIRLSPPLQCRDRKL